MILIVVLLLAVIGLVIFLGVSKAISGILTAIIVVSLWLFSAALASHHVGTWALAIVIGAPFAVVAVSTMVL